LNNKINILFLGGAKRYSLAERFIAAGNELDHQVNIFSYELETEVPIAGIGKVIVGKRWHDADLFDDVTFTIKKHSIHIILPFVDPSVGILAGYKKLNSSVFIPVSVKETCDLMYDKILAKEWFEKNKIPVPSDEMLFPMIAKPRKGSASQGIFRINSEEEYRIFQQKINLDEYLIQQYIDAEEFTVDSYVSENHGIIGVV